MKKLIISILTLFIALAIPVSVFAAKKEAEKEKINVYLFWGNGCGYCEAAKEFFASIEDEYGKYYNFVDYEVWYDQKNNELKNAVAEYLNDDVSGVPYIVIGETSFDQGYSSEFDADIIKAIKDEYENDDYVDVVAKVNAGEVKAKSNNYDTIIVIGIFVLIIGGFGALIYYSRK